MNLNTRLLPLLLIMALGLAACGQRGPLYLPDHKAETVRKQPAPQDSQQNSQDRKEKEKTQ